MQEEHFIVIGEVVGVFGVKGAIKVRSYSNPKENICNYSNLKLKDGEPIRLKLMRLDKNIVFCMPGEIYDRTSAEHLVGKLIYIPKSALTSNLPMGEFYINDLLNLEVRKDGKPIGTIIGIYNFGAGDIVEIKAK